MKAASKKFFFVLLSTLLIFSMLLPISAAADNPNSTLGTETPYMYCAFLDANGKQVDGNALAPGDYTVDVIVSDMANASILQFTADYDSSVITALNVTRTVADDANSDVSLGGIKDENDKLVIALASEDENYTALDAECGTSIATLEVSVDAAEGTTIDFEDYFTFSEDPDLTFLEADYADGYNDAYVVDTTVTTDYNTYSMNADASPEFLTISGTVVIATGLDAETGSNGIGGISIYNDVNFEPLATTAADGTFTALVPRGTKKLILTNHSFENGEHAASSTGTTIDREVSISGKADVAYEGVIPIIVCDYNKDGAITGADYQKFSQLLGVARDDANYNANYNINCDSSISGSDYQIWSKYVGNIDKSFTYVERTIQ